MDNINGPVKSIHEKVIYLERTEKKVEEFTDDEGNIIRRTYLLPDDTYFSPYGEFFNNPDGIVARFPKTWYYTQYANYKNYSRTFSKTGKRINEKWFEYNNKEFENIDFKYNENDSLILKTVTGFTDDLTKYNYDKLGKTSLVYINDLDKETRKDSLTFKYNENHKVIRIDFFQNNFYQFSMFSKYDNNNNLIEESEYNPNSFIDIKDIKNEDDLFKTDGSKFIYKENFYDEKNKKIQTNVYTRDGGNISKLKNKVFYIYDDFNNIMEERIQNFIVNSTSIRYFTYKNSLLFNEKYIDSGNSKLQINKYFYYNETNFIIKSEIKDRNESFLIEFKYKLDKKGNWIKQTKIINGVPKFILERKIEYYN